MLPIEINRTSVDRRKHPGVMDLRDGEALYMTRTMILHLHAGGNYRSPFMQVEFGWQKETMVVLCNHVLYL